MEAGLGVSGHGRPFGTVRTFPKAYQYRPVKIIIRVPRYTILSLAEGYANFSYVAFFICEKDTRNIPVSFVSPCPYKKDAMYGAPTKI